jgi:hypothetical protein
MIGNHVAMLLRLITDLLTGFAGEMTLLSKPLSAHWRHTDMSALLSATGARR